MSNQVEEVVEQEVEQTEPKSGCSAGKKCCKANLSATSHESIEKLAYEKWQEAGCPESDGIEFWLAAETELNECVTL
jgi:hypothetical protein